MLSFIGVAHTEALREFSELFFPAASLLCELCVCFSLQLLAQLEHPFVVKYLDSFMDGNFLKIVMNYCAGEPPRDSFSICSAPPSTLPAGFLSDGVLLLSAIARSPRSRKTSFLPPTQKHNNLCRSARAHWPNSLTKASEQRRATES